MSLCQVSQHSDAADSAYRRCCILLASMIFISMTSNSGITVCEKRGRRSGLSFLLMLPSSLLHFTSRQKSRLKNDYPSYINTFEDTLRALSLLLPGTSYMHTMYSPERLIHSKGVFKTVTFVHKLVIDDNEDIRVYLIFEKVLAGLNLISLVHTKVLVEKHLHTQGAVHGSFNAQFAQNYQAKRLCRLASWTLSIISYTEVVAEMLLRRKVTRMSRWKWITGIEGIKYTHKNTKYPPFFDLILSILTDFCFGLLYFMEQNER